MCVTFNFILKTACIFNNLYIVCRSTNKLFMTVERHNMDSDFNSIMKLFMLTCLCVSVSLSCSGYSCCILIDSSWVWIQQGGVFFSKAIYFFIFPYFSAIFKSKTCYNAISLKNTHTGMYKFANNFPLVKNWLKIKNEMLSYEQHSINCPIN